MESKKLDERQEIKDQVEILASKMTIAELAEKIETKAISPAMLGQSAKIRCAIFFITVREYSTEDVAMLFCVDVRTVQRWIKHIKAEVSLSLGVNFQKDIVADFLKKWNGQRQRLLRLSWSSELSELDKAKIIAMLHQLDMNKMVVLEKLGYLSKAQGMADMMVAMMKQSEDAARKNATKFLHDTEEDARLMYKVESVIAMCHLEKQIEEEKEDKQLAKGYLEYKRDCKEFFEKQKKAPKNPNPYE